MRLPKDVRRYNDDFELESYMPSDILFSGEQRKGVREVFEQGAPPTPQLFGTNPNISSMGIPTFLRDSPSYGS